MTISTDLILEDNLGNPVSLSITKPSGAQHIAVLTHGFASSKGSQIYLDLSDHLSAKGVAVIRYDYYGHGTLYIKPGGYPVLRDITLTKAVASLMRVLDYCREERFSRIGLFGSSFGGLVSLVAASRTQDISALALRSPVTDPGTFWSYRLKESEIDRWKESGVLKYTGAGEEYELEFDFWRDISKYQTLSEARKISCPTVIVHGDADTTVPIQQSVELSRVLNTPLLTIAGADHRYSDPLHYAEMREVVSSFLIKHLHKVSSNSL